MTTSDLLTLVVFLLVGICSREMPENTQLYLLYWSFLLKNKNKNKQTNPKNRGHVGILSKEWPMWSALGICERVSRKKEKEKGRASEVHFVPWVDLRHISCFLWQTFRFHLQVKLILFGCQTITIESNRVSVLWICIWPPAFHLCFSRYNL